MQSKKHGLQNSSVIVVSAVLVVLIVGSIIAFLKYQDRTNMAKQVEELIAHDEALPKAYLEAQKGLLGNWKFKHCTSTNNNCGRLE